MKRMSASDAKNHWGDLIKTVTEQGEAVVVENRREPILVAISPANFEEFQALRREKLLREVRESLQRIQEAQVELTRDLSAEDADSLIERMMEEDRAEHARSTSAPKSS